MKTVTTIALIVLAFFAIGCARRDNVRVLDAMTYKPVVGATPVLRGGWPATEPIQASSPWLMR